MLNKYRRFLCLLLLLALFAGCGEMRKTVRESESLEAEKAATTIFAMDTVMDLTIYGDAEILEQAEGHIKALEKLFSVTDADSEIYAANHTGQTALSDETADLLDAGLALCRRTDGALDLSIFPIVRAWGFTTGNYRVPEKQELTELLENVDYTQIHFDPEHHTVALKPGMEIDLGSIAKGYTGDQLMQLFRDSGVSSALLNLGGNVQTLGSKPDGSPWKIAVKDPLGEGNLGVLNIEDRAVITSGGYERYFEEDGRTYWHIIDPATGYPAQSGLVSVTVVGKEGTLCDGLSTSLFVMGEASAAAFWRSSDDFEAVFVRDDGSVLITEGLESSFTLVDGYAGKPVTVIRRD